LPWRRGVDSPAQAIDRAMNRRSSIAVCVTLIAVALVFWRQRMLLPAHEVFDVLANGDLFTQIYPMEHYAAALLRGWTVPLWNPYQFCGHPFLATGIYGVLYPLNAPYLALSTATAMELVLVAHFTLAGVFAALYAAALGVSPVSAFIAGISFMLSGFMILQAAWFPPAIAAASWLPLALLAVEKLAAGRGPRWSIVLAVGLAMPLMAGWPQTWLYAWYAVAFYAVARAISLFRSADSGSRKAAVRSSALIALGFVLAVGLIAVQLLPQMELQRLGPRRAGGLSLSQARFATGYSLHDFLRDVLDSRPGTSRWPYVGIATLILLPLAPIARSPRAFYFTMVAFASIAIAVTVQTPLFYVYRLLPGATWFRAPMRILFLWAFAASILSAIGVEAAIMARRRNDQRLLIATAVMAAVVVVVLCVNVGSLAPTTLLFASVAAVLVAVVIVVPSASWRHALTAVLALMLTYDLFTANVNPYFRPYHDATAFDGERNLLNYIHVAQGLERTYIHVLLDGPAMMAKDGTLYRIYSITDYEPLSLHRFERFYAALQGDDREQLMTFVGALHADPARPSFRLLDLLSVRYVVAQRTEADFIAAIDRLQPKWQAQPALSRYYTLYRNTDPLPRAYVVDSARFVDDEDQALAATTAPDFDPRTTVVIERSPTADQSPNSATSPLTAARIVEYAPRIVRIEAEAVRPSYLVLTDTHYPGWVASVDGNRVEILRANYLLRAVGLQPGKHVVEFRYEPWSFRIGACITVATLLASIVIFFRQKRASTSTSATSAPTT